MKYSKVRILQVDFNSPSSLIHKVDPGLANGEMVARLMGFLRLPLAWQEMLNVCVSFCSASLSFVDDVIANISAIDQKNCNSVKFPDNFSMDRITVDFKARKAVTTGQSLQYQQSKMELLHYKDLEDAPKVRYFIYSAKSIQHICLFKFKLLMSILSFLEPIENLVHLGQRFPNYGP